MEPLPDPATWRRTREVFDQVVSLAPDARAARLAELCRDAPEIRREVESLLEHASVSDAAFAAVVGGVARDTAEDEAGLHEGQLLLHYRLVARIGEGSMGTVWRATDHTLGRDVAIKVLPGRVSRDPARISRFELEAKLLASLNHPNIAAIYSVHHADGVRFLAMELVDGDDLTGPIARGPLPLDQVVSIARQIATGLEEAHEKGIVHRDLKPANVKVRGDGTVKVLDFGLAKAFAGDTLVETGLGDDGRPRSSAPAATRLGVVLGTAAYMPPEQARGRPVDKRADIWAFGVILFEMLAGQRPFVGVTVTDVLAAVVEAEPDWTLLPPATPAPLVRLIRRCLEKDSRRRLRDIGDARLELDEGPATSAPAPTGTSSPAPKTGRRWRAAALLAVGGVALMAFGAARWGSRSPVPVDRPDVAFAIQPSPGGRAIVNELALSRDGRRLVFRSSDSPRLLLREMGGLEHRAIAGTEGAEHPFISPDGRWLGFFADGKLKKVAFDGGDAVPICDAALEGPGASWGFDGSIYFTPTYTSGLLKVDSSGGAPIQVTTPDRARGEAGHMWVDPLPGGTAAVFTVFGGSGMNGSSIALLDLATGRYRVLFEGAAARYVASGHLVFNRRGTYYAVPFDPATRKVTGPDRAVLSNARRPDPTGEMMPLAFSEDGRLAYVSATWPIPTAPSRLAWLSRTGVPTVLPFEGVHHAFRVSLSPDGRRVAVARYAQGESQIWIYDLAHGTQEQLTRVGINTSPVWHPDGTEVAFTSLVGGTFDILRAAADGSSRPEPLMATDRDESWPLWVQDGRALIVLVYSEVTGPDLARQVLTGSGHPPQPLVATSLADNGAMVSRDGKWLAYNSGNVLYVSPFPGMGSRTLVARGARAPRWADGAGELFFLQGDDVMVARYGERSGTFEVGAPQRLFEAPQIAPHVSTYDVSADGTRLLFLVPMAGQVPGDDIHVRLNGFDELTRN